MWSAGSEGAQVYLGLNAVGVRGHDASGCAHWLPASSPIDGWKQAAELLATAGRRRAAVSLTGALMRPFCFNAVPGLQRWREAAHVAASLAPEATGLVGTCGIWLGDWSPQATSLAVAIEQSLRQSIEATAKQHRIRLTALRPWWAHALATAANREAGAPRLLAVEDTDALTLLCGDEGLFTAASSYAPLPDPKSARALINRAMLGSNVPTAQAMHATMFEPRPLNAGALESTQENDFGVRLELIE